MKIEQVKIKEFKCLKDLDTNVSGNNILLVGDNAVGKSTFMQFIQIALGNTDVIPPAVNGDGHIIIDKEGRKYSIEVKVKEGKSHIVITTDEGLKDTRKGFLAQLTGAMDFDIDEFVELSKSESGRKKQVDIFKQFLPTEVQLKIRELERSIETYFNERTEVNRHVKYTEGALDTLKCESCEEPESMMEISKQLTDACNYNNTIKYHRMNIVSTQERINSVNSEIKELEAEKKELQSQSDISSEFIESNKPIDTDILKTKLAENENKREKYSKHQQYKIKLAEASFLKGRADGLTQQIEDSRTQFTAVIKSAKTPVKGLSFTEGNLLYNGVPVNENNLSTSEIMNLGFLLKMAENPELGILFVKRAESLGQDKYDALLTMAKENNLQLIIEQVQRGQDKLKIEIFK